MKREIISLNTDTPNKYNMLFPITTLEANLKDTYQQGISSCIGHDFHMPFGFTYPFGLYFEPHITRFLGTKLTPENADDQKNIDIRHKNNLLRKINESFDAYGEKLMPLIEKDIVGQWYKIDPSCAAAFNLGIAARHFENLFSNKDDAGLIPLQIILADFIYLGEGVFKHKSSDCCVFAHSYFRRSQSPYNNFHFYFLDELLLLKDNKDINIKLCLDEDMIGYAPSFMNAMELQFHFGPKFTDDIASIKFGITRHECDELEHAFTGITSTEFYWKTDEHEKTFELEELKDKPSPTSEIETYRCRYMHSIYDTSQNTFVHFDGAIRSYGMEEMYERLGVDFLEYGRKAEYKKLFRIDGKLPLHLWKLLVIHYMQDNPLVYEYFGMKEEHDAHKIQHTELDPVKKLLPIAINKETGIRLLVSYHYIPEDLLDGRYIDIFDEIEQGTETHRVVEYYIFELKKSLMVQGENLEIPEDVLFLRPGDRYMNFPSIMHYGTNASELLSGTITAYLRLFEAMQADKKDFDISITLAGVFNGRVVRVSAYGNIDCLIKWMKNSLPFPTEEHAFTEWLVKQRKWLQSFKPSPDDPLITSIVQPDGVLYIKRNPVKYKYSFFADERGIGYELEVPADDTTLEFAKTNGIQPTILQIVKQMAWSDTGEDYFTGPRSKWLEKKNKKSTVNISEAAPILVFWSRHR